jgi:uncharacterized LabA/DUF88 family protein
MKTIVYIDGYNLFYGCIKHSNDKWLDLFKLFNGLLTAQCGEISSLHIKFFTADIKAKVASNGDAARIAQQSYHRALKELYTSDITIVKGYYTLEKAHLPAYKNPIDKNSKVEVWRLEEKQTDVNISLHAYRDAAQGHAEQLVFVSNDTDLQPALEAIREDFGDRHQIGVVIPVRKPKPNQKHRRPPNNRLSEQANWTRHYLTDEELANNQLPDKIPTRKKPILKPNYW